MNLIVFFLEERSAREMLNGLLPRILPEDVEHRLIVFEGKQDLEKNLVRRLRGWQRPKTHFVVMRDQDFGSCHEVKRNLAELCRQAGKPRALIRIACRELESFYLGDLKAVEKGLELNNLSTRQLKAKYRAPDLLQNPANELKKLTNHQYQKISGSRAIGPFLSLSGNRSRSFRTLVRGIQTMTSALQDEP